MNYCPEDIPIIIPCFNRPEMLKQVLENLGKADLIQEFNVHFSFDTKEVDTKNGKEVLELCKSFKKSKNIFIHHRENIFDGTLNSVGAIGYILSKVENAECFIYLEDDIIISKCFLKFCVDALNFYQDCEYCFGVSGYGRKVNIDGKCISKVQYLGNSILWGVAGWKSKWKWINDRIKLYCKYPKFFENDVKNSIVPHYTRYFRKNFDQVEMIPKNKCGGGLVNAYIFSFAKLFVRVNVSLCDNIGWYGWHIPKELAEEKYNSFQDSAKHHSESFRWDNGYSEDFPEFNEFDVARFFEVKVEELKSIPNKVVKPDTDYEVFEILNPYEIKPIVDKYKQYHLQKHSIMKMSLKLLKYNSLIREELIRNYDEIVWAKKNRKPIIHLGNNILENSVKIKMEIPVDVEFLSDC